MYRCIPRRLDETGNCPVDKNQLSTGCSRARNGDSVRRGTKAGRERSRQFEWSSLRGCIRDESVLCMSGHERSASCLHGIRLQHSGRRPSTIDPRAFTRAPRLGIPKPFLINRNYAGSRGLTGIQIPVSRSRFPDRDKQSPFNRPFPPRKRIISRMDVLKFEGRDFQILV